MNTGPRDSEELAPRINALFEESVVVRVSQRSTRLVQKKEYGYHDPLRAAEDQGNIRDLRAETQARLAKAIAREGYARGLQAAGRAEEELTTAAELPDEIEIDGRLRPTRNSEGQLIDRDEAGIRAFYVWFGNSVMEDAKERPLLLYDGGLIDEKADKDARFARLPAFFSPDGRLAEGYARRPGSRVTAVYLKIENPFRSAGLLHVSGGAPLAIHSASPAASRAARTPRAQGVGPIPVTPATGGRVPLIIGLTRSLPFTA